MQQVLLAVATSVDGWKPDGADGSFRRWLATVARNIVIKFMTRERRQVSGYGGTDMIDLLQNVAEPPNADHLRRYEHELIVWAAEQVRGEFIETSWTAFWATVIDGRSVNDVATELNITPGSIYMSRSRIMAKIRKLIEKVME
ncbi:MAG: sigma-70 family RNA polymerase sigma factor [Planctomycetaceae bacterium]